MIARPMLTAALLLALSVSSWSQKHEERTVAKGEAGKAIVEWVKASVEKGFTGAILASKDGKVVAATGVGLADPGRKLPNTPATLFEIASFSKQFTGAAAARLAQENRVRLDDPIAKSIEGVPESCKGITLRHLLQHTSGIPGSNSAGGGDDVARVLPSFLEGGPRHPPGTHWEYWNQGYALATEVIALASGLSFVEYSRKHVFKPAGLKVTCFTGDPAPGGVTVAIGSSSRGNARSALEHPYGSFGFQYRGMGGVVTSVMDLFRWDRALEGKRVLNDTFKAELFKPGLEDYALGWRVKKERGREVQSHGGSVRGFVCEGRRYPGQGAAIFVLANNDTAPIKPLADGIEQLLFGEALTVALPSKADVGEGAHLIGTYLTPEGDELRIFPAEGLRAEVKWTRGSTSRMLIAKDPSGAFAVFVNTDRYPLGIAEREGAHAKVLELWGRTFTRKP